MLYVGSPETLVIAAIFLDVLMTTILTPLAPTLTPSYQKIAVLTSSKNVVTCLIAPFVGSYIDGNEAKSMQHGMLCAMICSLGLAVVENYWLWLAIRCVSGCSTAAIVWGGFATLSRLHAKKAAQTGLYGLVNLSTLSLHLITSAGPRAGVLFVDDAGSLFPLLIAGQMCARSAQQYILYDALLAPKLPKLPEADAERNSVIASLLALSFIAALGSTAIEHMVRLGYDQMKQKLDNIALICLGLDYIPLAVTLLGASFATGIADGNTQALLVSFRFMCQSFGTCMLLYAVSLAAPGRPIELCPPKLSTVPSGRQVQSVLKKETLRCGFACGVASLELFPSVHGAAGESDEAQGRDCPHVHADTFAAAEAVYAGSQAFIYRAPGTPYPKGAIYGRFDHPTRLKLEQCHQSCEMVPHALAFSTYEAAAASVLTLLKTGDRMLALGLRQAIPRDHAGYAFFICLNAMDKCLQHFFKETAAQRAFQYQDDDNLSMSVRTTNMFRVSAKEQPYFDFRWFRYGSFQGFKYEARSMGLFNWYLAAQLRMSNTLAVESVTQTSFQLRILGEALGKVLFSEDPSRGTRRFYNFKLALVVEMCLQRRSQSVVFTPGGTRFWQNGFVLQYPKKYQEELCMLEKMVAEAHIAKFAVALASGSAAYHVLLDQLAPGDHVIASNKLFVGAFEAFQDIAADAYGVTFTFVDLDDLGAVAAAILPETRLLWVESASNPLGHPADVPGLAKLCKEHRERSQQRLHLVVDNTWCGPYALRPLMQGADLVVESLTKTIGGHSDLLLGAVCTRFPCKCMMACWRLAGDLVTAPHGWTAIWRSVACLPTKRAWTSWCQTLEDLQPL
ncbi:metB [Symbiodinium pilosum]|uniref:cystathionine gamma-lyase n=1 Tax=Symbiodinium pilosum TaxID=2952 RepID=A0A812R839_SYMPI|nr:metB [Symbiodinium pilosum]